MVNVSTELKQKVENAIQGNRLVGNVSFSDEDYERLLEYTRYYSLRYDNLSYIGDDKMTFVTLVEIAKRWKRIDDDDDSEKGFWEFVVKRLLGEEYVDQKLNKLSNVYRSLIYELGQNGKILFANDVGKKYWATLMMHAFAPIKSIYVFLDLGYNIYRKDLGFNYTESDKGFCRIATKQFCDILQNTDGNDKPISIGTNTYCVKIGLRSLARNYENDFIALLDNTLGSIHKLFHKQTFKLENYFDDIVHKWWQSKLTEVFSDRKIGRGSTPAVSKQNITVKFIRDNQKVFLVVPPIRLDNGVASNVYLSISVYIGDKYEQLISEELFTKIGEFTVTTKQKDINLNEFFQVDKSIRLHVKIIENEVVVFDKEIKREFILFDGENEILSQVNKMNSNYFVYTWKNITTQLTMPTNVSTIARNLYNIYPMKGETLLGEIQQVFFEELASVHKSDIYLSGSLSNCIWWFGDLSCVVFSGQVMLFIPDEIGTSGLDLYVGSTRILLSQLSSVEHLDSYHFFDVTNCIPKREPCEITVYSHLKEERLLHKNIVVFPGLRAVPAKAAFYGNDEKTLTISIDGNNDILSWDNTQREVLYKLNGGDLIVKIPYIRWRVDKKEWHNESFNKKVWHKNHFHNGSLLEIDLPLDTENVKVFALLNANPDYVELNKVSREFEVGRYIFTNEYKKEIMFFLSYPEMGTHGLFIVATEEHFDDEPLTYSNGKLFWHPEDTFIGDEDRIFKLEFNRKDNKPFCVDGLRFRDEELIIKGLYDGVYKVKIISLENGLSKNETEIDMREIIVGRKEVFRFVNKCIKIEYGYVELGIGEDAQMYWKPFKGDYRIDHIDFMECGGREFYIGRLCAIDVNSKKISLGTIHIDNVTNNTLEIKMESREMLKYDKEKQSICKIYSSDCNRYCYLYSYKFKVEEATNV